MHHSGAMHPLRHRMSILAHAFGSTLHMTRSDAIVARRFRVFGLWILRRCQKIGFLWTKFAEVGNFAAIFGPLLRNHYVAQRLYLGFLETALFTMAASRCESLQKTPISAIFVRETAKIWH